MDAIDVAWRKADAEWEAAGRELAALLEAARRGGSVPGPGDALPSSGWRVLARAPLGDGEPGSEWGQADLWALRAPAAGGPGAAAGPGRVVLVATAAPVPFRPVEASPRARADLERLRDDWRARLRGLEALLTAADAVGGSGEAGAGGGRVVVLAPAAGPAARPGPGRAP